MGRNATVPQKLGIAGRRERLQIRIENWIDRTPAAALFQSAKKSSHLPPISEDEFDEDNGDDAAWSICSDEAADDISDPSGHDRPSIPAELLPLPFPSDSTGLSTDSMRQTELCLRIGQANDALHGIRLALGHKSFQFRHSIRQHRSQNQKTRAWDGVHAIAREATLNAKLYKHTRAKLLLLNAPEDVMAKFQRLLPKHMAVSTAIAQPNARGQSSQTMSWFWTLDVAAEAQSDSWMAECLCYRF